MKGGSPKETGDIAFVMMRLQVRFFSEFCANMYMEGERRIQVFVRQRFNFMYMLAKHVHKLYMIYSQFEHVDSCTCHVYV